MDLNIKNIDIKKLDLGLRHEYVPQTDFNLALDEDDRIVVDCEYFAVGEKMKFMEFGEDKKVSIDYPKIFKKKVKGIRNFSINGKPVTTADELLRYPGVNELDLIVTDVGAHIFHSDDLTEDEEKN